LAEGFELLESKKEGVHDLENNPICFGYRDDANPSCRLRCRLKAECYKWQLETRPPCFGNYVEGKIECNLCIDASQCIDAGEIKMPKIVIKKKGAPVVAPVVESVVEEQTEEELLAEAEDEMTEVESKPGDPRDFEEEAVVVTDEDITASDWYQLPVPDLRVECQHRGLPYIGTKEALVKRILENELAAAETPVAPAPKPVVKPIAKVVVAPKPVMKVAVAPKPVIKTAAVAAKPVAVAPKPVAKPVAVAPKPVAIPKRVEADVNFFTVMLEHLDVGKSITITHVAEPDQWVAALGGEVAGTAVVGKHTRKAGIPVKEMFSPEFTVFIYDDAGDGKGWLKHTKEEKYAFAEANQITWDRHESEQLDVIRMSAAVREALGIEKWKPEYASRAARRGGKETEE